MRDNLFNSINRYHTLHKGDDVSDHSPVCMSVYIKRPNEIDLNCEDYPSQFIWHKASGNNLLNYKNSLNNLLSKIKVPWKQVIVRIFFCNIHSQCIIDFCPDVWRHMILLASYIFRCQRLVTITPYQAGIG